MIELKCSGVVLGERGRKTENVDNPTHVGYNSYDNQQ